MGEKHFVWDEISDGLTLLGVQKTEDEQVRGHRKKSDPVHASKVFCPHSYLILNFQETLNQGEKIKFRKHYLRKVSPNEPDVVILQDIKDLVLFLLLTPIRPQFINFFHLPIVDRFLRALILYFQHYVTIWEELMEERAATMKKAPNLLAQGYRSRYANEMQCLRCLLGREYADLIIGCQDTIRYHHMTAGKKGAVTQSQGEKDLRVFEVLIGMAHRIVWIALERKHLNLIEIELHRLLRTKAYNTAERQATSQTVENMLKDDTIVLQGPGIQARGKLLRNSPLIQELVYSDCDYRALCLGIDDNDVNNPRISYLRNALAIEEERLPELGIKVGILGHDRGNYDVMLMPFGKDELEQHNEGQISDKVQYERTIRKETFFNTHENIKSTGLPQSKSTSKLSQVFPIREIKISPKGYRNACKDSRRKWLVREIKRHNVIQVDTYSTGTSLD